jgi:HAD superfamily hydrolase (TIGR01490 family)
MVRWAVFDVDGTLLPKSSMEQRFLLHLLKRGVIPHKNIVSYFFSGTISTLKSNWVEGFKNNKRYLKGLPVEEIKTLAKYFYQNAISPALSQTGLNTVEQYRKEGFKILIMSGSPDFLTEHLVAQIKEDHFIWTTMEIMDGKFTGNIVGMHPYGSRKKQILEELQPKLEIDFNGSIVFANHHADVPHMEMFGNAMAVNPTTTLKKIAKERGWEVEYWR